MELLLQDVASLKEKLSTADSMREEATAKDAGMKKMWYSKEYVSTDQSVIFTLCLEGHKVNMMQCKINSKKEKGLSLHGVDWDRTKKE